LFSFVLLDFVSPGSSELCSCMFLSTRSSWIIIAFVFVGFC
jgi:hypothetical protein